MPWLESIFVLFVDYCALHVFFTLFSLVGFHCRMLLSCLYLILLGESGVRERGAMHDSLFLNSIICLGRAWLAFMFTHIPYLYFRLFPVVMLSLYFVEEGDVAPCSAGVDTRFELNLW